MVCYAIHITGSVYKTGFRYYLKEKAAQLQITGCIFYLPDHSAGIISSGEEMKMQEFISLCKQGNPASEVTKAEISQVPLIELSSFEVIGENEPVDQAIKKIIQSFKF